MLGGSGEKWGLIAFDGVAIYVGFLIKLGWSPTLWVFPFFDLLECCSWFPCSGCTDESPDIVDHICRDDRWSLSDPRIRECFGGWSIHLRIVYICRKTYRLEGGRSDRPKCWAYSLLPSYNHQIRWFPLFNGNTLGIRDTMAEISFLDCIAGPEQVKKDLLINAILSEIGVKTGELLIPYHTFGIHRSGYIRWSGQRGSCWSWRNGPFEVSRYGVSAEGDLAGWLPQRASSISRKVILCDFIQDSSHYGMSSILFPSANP